MRRWLLAGFVLVVALAAIDQVVAQVRGTRPIVPVSVAELIAERRTPILVGLIHSQTGPLAISEKIARSTPRSWRSRRSTPGAGSPGIGWNGRSPTAGRTRRLARSQARRLIDDAEGVGPGRGLDLPSAARRCSPSSRRRRAC